MSQPPRRDLLHTNEIKALVRDTYHAVASPAGAVARKLYPAEELAQVPQIAIDGALGVASPLRHADIEDIPLPDRSIDQIISNGVLNLCPRKARAFAECRRVLRPGGKLCVADMTVEEDDLPAAVLTHPAAWTGCTAGALTEHDFARKLDRAGFGEVQIVDRQPQSIDDLAVYPPFPAELLQLMRTHIPPGKHARIATAIVVKAVARSDIEPRPRPPSRRPGTPPHPA